MTHYYRAHVPGATCFFSVHLARRDTWPAATLRC